MINLKDEALSKRMLERMKSTGRTAKIVDGVMKFFFPIEHQPSVKYKKKPIGKIICVSPDDTVSIETDDYNILLNQKFRRYITI